MTDTLIAKKIKNFIASCDEALLREKRQLTSQKNKDWTGYLCVFATLKGTMDLFVEKEQFSQLVEGAMYDVTCELHDKGFKLSTFKASK